MTTGKKGWEITHCTYCGKPVTQEELLKYGEEGYSHCPEMKEWYDKLDRIAAEREAEEAKEEEVKPVEASKPKVQEKLL